MPLNQPDITELRAIVDWVNVTEDIRELSIKYGDVELFISRNHARAARPETGGVVTPAPAPAAPAPAAPAAAAPAPGPVAPTPVVETSDLAPNEELVKAPMVGVFYASPKPGDPPFVKAGDPVDPETPLGIVEVMKLMNTIYPQVRGTIARILVENEQAVGFGQPLMVITRND